MPDTLFIFEKGHQVIYKIPKTQQYFINDSLVKTAQAFEYFIYRKGDSLGMFYPTLDSTTPDVLTLPVDSMRFNRGYKADFSRVLALARLVRSEGEPDLLTETYTTGNSGNPQMFDSIYCYYDRKKADIPYSLDSTLDQQKRSKLYKVEILFNQHSGTDGPFFPRRMMAYQIFCEHTDDLSIVRFLQSTQPGGKK